MTTSQVFRRSRSVARAAVLLGFTAGAVLMAAAAASASNGYTEAADPGEGLTLVQTLLLFVAAPAAIFGLIALIVLGPSMGKGARHRTGAALETGPVWIDPSGAHSSTATVRPTGTAPTEQGGVSAHW